VPAAVLQRRLRHQDRDVRLPPRMARRPVRPLRGKSQVGLNQDFYTRSQSYEFGFTATTPAL
jgi:hypothetical protein